MRGPGDWACALLIAAGCASPTIGSLSIDLVLPDSPDPGAEVRMLRVDATWDGGHLEQDVPYADGGVRLGLPTGTPIDLRIEGIASTGGAALWRGQARGATVPDRGNEAVRMFFGKVGTFSNFTAVAEMPPLAGTAAAPWDAGQVILAGGLDQDGGANFGIWVYDHQRVTMSLVASLITARSWARALALEDEEGQGFLMVAGGLGSGGGAMAAAELFRPPSTHVQLPNLIAAQRLPGGVPLDPSGLQILVGCGAGAPSPLTQVQVYAPAKAFLDAGNPLPAPPLQLGDDCRGGQITAARGLTAAFVSGESHGGIERIDWVAPGSVSSFGSVGAAPPARAGFAAIDSPQGLVLVGGRKNGISTDEVNRVDGGTGKLREARADFGWLVVPDAGVLVVGGRAAIGTPLALATAEWLDLATLTSAPAGRMSVGRIGSAVAQIPGYGAALVVSGQDDTGAPVGGLEIYTYP